MIKTISDLQTYFQTKVSPHYSRENLDLFLKQYPLNFPIPSIHITGTNGKGSTAMFLRNLYQSAFKKVGLFTSPALSRFQEMITINGQEISDQYILQFFQDWQGRFEAFSLTTFEMQTLLAFHYFLNQRCDFAVIEVGMGGKLDATNIFTPVVSVITTISLEHQAYLGGTLEAIAEHKAGIIKPHVPVVVGPLPLPALEVVQSVAHRQDAPLFIRQPFQVHPPHPYLNFDYDEHHHLNLSMRARYQMANAALALAVVDVLQTQYPLNEPAIQKAIFETFVPGRLEIVQTQPQVIVDGAHNPGAIETLVDAMQPFHHGPITILFAAFKDKEIGPMLQSLSTLSKAIVLTTFPHPRAREEKDYRGQPYPFMGSYQTAIQTMLAQLPKHGVLLVTGSLAFIGLVRQQFEKK